MCLASVAWACHLSLQKNGAMLLGVATVCSSLSNIARTRLRSSASCCLLAALWSGGAPSDACSVSEPSIGWRPLLGFHLVWTPTCCDVLLLQTATEKQLVQLGRQLKKNNIALGKQSIRGVAAALEVIFSRTILMEEVFDAL